MKRQGDRKRILIKEWDDVNERLVVRYYKLYFRDKVVSSAKLVIYESPILQGSVEKARSRHCMKKKGITMYIDCLYVKELMGVFGLGNVGF
jgi:hypothetical protein